MYHYSYRNYPRGIVYLTRCSSKQADETGRGSLLFKWIFSKIQGNVFPPLPKNKWWTATPTFLPPLHPGAVCLTDTGNSHAVKLYLHPERLPTLAVDRKPCHLSHICRDGAKIRND